MSLVRNLAGLAGAVIAGGLLAVPAQAADTTPQDVQPYIIDGREVDSAPWAARLFVNDQETCTASIIAPEWVLTAQHCVADAADGNGLSFNIGDVDQTKGEHANAIPGEVHIHDTADVALVKIDHAVQTEYAPLGDAGTVNPGDTVQTYGWGATCTDKPEIECQAPILKVADVNVTGVNGDCTDYRGGQAICASRGDGIPAGGDSGGPMFAGDKQVGVASTSDRATSTAYVNITEYRDWISSLAGV
ncbi:trypsin-like serine protease [Saccharopolyspora terrae]|uniref:Trypsin-like serine protease n=1 Tax=Saccharopolyspora terrae TaxID=2530384 RepID=A0A4R4VH39_9PSEU|nr:trypsin-like serine protease [Saccharopolyspora terrae]TDD01484.1 trypsin-like serine protease [Saccharopolyspora terrae]